MPRALRGHGTRPRPPRKSAKFRRSRPDQLPALRRSPSSYPGAVPSVVLDLPPVASTVHSAFRKWPTESWASEGTPAWPPLSLARPERVERPSPRSLRELQFELALAPEVALQPSHERTRFFANP